MSDGGRAQAQANHDAAAAIVGALENAGVRHAIASPGGRNIPLLLALEHTTLQVTSVLDERQAGFVALGVALATRSPTAAVATSGSAAAHYLPAAAEASANEVPLVLVSADRPAERHGFGAPQTLTQAPLLAAQVRGAIALQAPTPGTLQTRWTAASVAQGVAAAVGPRPGPVHINAPFREPLWHVEAEVSPPPVPPRRLSAPRPRPDEATLRRLGDRIASARRGVVVCGPTVGLDRDTRAIAQLAEHLGWPLLADLTSGLRLTPSPSPNLVTTHEALLACPDFADRAAPDLILRFGREPVARSTWEWLTRVSRNTHCLHVAPSANWHDPALGGDELVVSAAGDFCRALEPAVGARIGDAEWLTWWRQAEQGAAAVLSEACHRGFTEASVASTVASALEPGAQLLAGNSMPVRDLDLFARPLAKAVDVIANRGVSGIDGHIATAVGLALGRPDRPTVALMGDLTALHDLGALALVAQTRLPLTLVVVDNRGGGIFEHLPISQRQGRTWFETTIATTHGIDLAAVGRAMGLVVHEVSNTKDLRACLTGLQQQRTPALIVARVDRAKSVANRKTALATVRAQLTGAQP